MDPAQLRAEEHRVVSLTFHRGAFPKTAFREFARLDSVISAAPFETGHVRETDRRCIARNPSGHTKKYPKQKSVKKSKYP